VSPTGEVEPEAGISNLKGVVYRLRRVLGEAMPPPIVLEHGWVLLNPSCSVEIDADRPFTVYADGDPLAMRMLSGEVHAGNNMLTFESDFRMPAMPKIE